MKNRWRVKDLQAVPPAGLCPDGYSYSQYQAPIASCPSDMRWHKVQPSSGEGSCFKCRLKTDFKDRGGWI